MSILTLSLLTVVAGSLPTLAAVPVVEKGEFGPYVLADSTTKPGVACTYDADVPGAQGNDIDIMEAKGPRVFARDRSGGRDPQTVGVKFLFQRSVNEGGTGGWVTEERTSMVKKTAYDDQAAGFAKRAWLVPLEDDYQFRALAIIRWFEPGSTTEVEGSVMLQYVYYQVVQGGPQGVEQDRCLPEP
jgi:hypothetical protein